MSPFTEDWAWSNTDGHRQHYGEVLEASGLLNGRYDSGGKITENRGEEPDDFMYFLCVW